MACGCNRNHNWNTGGVGYWNGPLRYSSQCPGGCLALIGGRYRCSNTFTGTSQPYCPYR